MLHYKAKRRRRTGNGLEIHAGVLNRHEECYCVLQCAAVRCSDKTEIRLEMHASELQNVAVCCVCCCMLQDAADCCRVLQCDAVRNGLEMHTRV